MSHPIRRPVDARATALMVLLCLIWGVQQSLMKGIAADVPPLLQIAIRFAGASLFYGAVLLRAEGLAAFRDGTWRSGVVLGLLFSGEFVAVGQALLHTTSAHVTVFLYSAPIFTAIGMRIFPSERLSGAQWSGILLAFAGLACAFLGYTGRSMQEMLTGDLTALLGGAFWGVSTIWLRRTRIGNASTYKTVFYQVSVATVVATLYAAAMGEMHLHWTTPVALNLAYQTIVIAVLSYLTWFWLLRHYLTSRLMPLTLLTPLFAVIAGRVFLGEAIEPRFAFGTALVLGGILIINAGHLLQRPKESTP